MNIIFHLDNHDPPTLIKTFIGRNQDCSGHQIKKNNEKCWLLSPGNYYRQLTKNKAGLLKPALHLTFTVYLFETVILQKSIQPVHHPVGKCFYSALAR